MSSLRLGDSVPRRKGALKRDDEIEREEGLHVVVRLGAALLVGDLSRRDQAGRRPVLIREEAGRRARHRGQGPVAGRDRLIGVSGIAMGHQVVGMVGHVAVVQEDARRAAPLTKPAGRQSGPVTGMHYRPVLQVGQGERGPPVAAVGRAEDGEKRRVLGDRQERSVAKRPAPWREIAGEDPDLRYEWV